MTIDTKKLRSLAEKATPGPWVPEDDDTPDVIRGPHHEHLAIVSMVDDFGCIDADENPEQYKQAETECLANAAFIAAANPQTVIALLDVVAAAETMADYVSRFPDSPHNQPPGDWACAECKPYSDILIAGFRCAHHGLLHAVAELRKVGAP